MAIDPARLTQSELLQMVNATPLGKVLTRGRLRRQMDAGGMRFGDGRTIHLVRYAAWLINERANPRPTRIDYSEARRRQAQRNRAATKASQDIAPIPEIAGYERRRACGESLRVFYETYFPAIFWRPWSDDHLRVITKVERAVHGAGLFAFAMPRGTGKSAMSWCAAIWAVLYGYRPFVCLIGGADKAARELLRSIRMAVLENEPLLADFPEAIYPLRCLENSSKRQLQQHCNGQLTHVHWGQDKMVFPTLGADDLPEALSGDGYDGSPSSGSIITTTSLDSNLRGQQHARADGSLIRPSLALLDDPQTRESALSADQTSKRLALLHGDVLGMAGPGEEITALMTCTKMYEGDLADRVLGSEEFPEWESECTKLVYSFPSDEKAWRKYVDLRRTRGKAGATEYYRKHRERMDEGARVGWTDRYDAKAGEISALQHAMNLRLRVGPEAFAAEYQNEPATRQMSDQALTVDQVLEKVNGYKHRQMPPAATKLTMFIDVHDKVLFYAVCAWEENFTGYLIDYGTFPDQRRSVFAMADAQRTLRRSFRGMGVDGAIHAGLERLVKDYLNRNWKRGAGLMRIDRLLIDMGYKPRVVAAVQRKVGGSSVMLAKGVGLRASRKPIAEYARRPGETIGHHWHIPNVRKTGQFPHVMVDVNYWKRFLHEGFATAAGDAGSISIFGRERREHELLAGHVARSEKWVEVTGPGGVVWEWSALPARPDNHWLDCLVGCAAAASMCGVKVAGEAVVLPRPRKRYTQEDLRRKRYIGR